MCWKRKLGGGDEGCVGSKTVLTGGGLAVTASAFQGGGGTLQMQLAASCIITLSSNTAVSLQCITNHCGGAAST